MNLFNNFSLFNLSFWIWIGLSNFIWKWLHENSRLWLLVSRLVLHFKLNPRKSDWDSQMSDFIFRWVLINLIPFIQFFLLTLAFDYRICDERIFLVEERNFSFYDLASLKGSSDNSLIGIDSNLPVAFDLFKAVVNYSADACFWSDLHKAGFFIRVFLCNKLYDVLFLFRNRIGFTVFLWLVGFSFWRDLIIFNWRGVDWRRGLVLLLW